MLGPIFQYYVNDGDLTGDQYTTAVGDDSNDGLDPSRPKASIRSVLDTYDLGPGDIILVQGTYDNISRLKSSRNLLVLDARSTIPVSNKAPIAVLIMLSSLLAVIYVWRVVEVMYFRAPPPDQGAVREAPVSMLVPMYVLIGAAFWFGIDATFTGDVAMSAAEEPRLQTQGFSKTLHRSTFSVPSDVITCIASLKKSCARIGSIP